MFWSWTPKSVSRPLGGSSICFNLPYLLLIECTELRVVDCGKTFLHMSVAQATTARDACQTNVARGDVRCSFLRNKMGIIQTPLCAFICLCEVSIDEDPVL